MRGCTCMLNSWLVHGPSVPQTYNWLLFPCISKDCHNIFPLSKPKGVGPGALAGWEPLGMLGSRGLMSWICALLSFPERHFGGSFGFLQGFLGNTGKQWLNLNEVTDREGLKVLAFLCVVRCTCKWGMLLKATKCPWAVGSGVKGWELLSQPLCN